MTNNKNIHFYFNSTSIGLTNRNALKKWLSSIFLEEGKLFSDLNFIFCTDEFLLSINNEFLMNALVPYDGELYKEPKYMLYLH